MQPIVTLKVGGVLEDAANLDLAEGLDTESVAEFSRALQMLEDAQIHEGVMSTAEDEAVALLQTYMAEQLRKDQRLLLLPGGGEEAVFDEHDFLGYAKSFFTWWRGIKKHGWMPAPHDPEPLPPTFRLALFGDWGTGRYGAPRISHSIATAPEKYDVVLHLGDVYYSGTDSEVQDNMLLVWPEIPGATSRGLNGNHEMYTGGHAYFNLVLPRFRQAASYFAMQNQHWLLVGLDTAYDDHDLHGEQVAWLESLVARAPDQCKVILFSHHQPFSLIDKQGPKLVRKLSRLLTSKRIYAWYWGHEHHCILYDRHALWGFLGRCAGHGGFPYFREKKLFGTVIPDRPTWRRMQSKNLVPAAQVLDGTNQYVEGHEKEYGPHGYVTLEFEGDRAMESVHEAEGGRLYYQPLK